jgi:SSS family solute:Na+ symporter
VIDLGIIGGYLCLMLFLGWRSRRQSAESYWVAERRYDTARVTASLVATIFGASSTMGIIGLGYERGLTGAWWALIGGLALIPFALLLASRVRSLNVYTLPDILKTAYGERVSLPAGCMIAIAWCGVIAAQLVAGGRLLSSLVSIDFQVALGIVAVVFILYTLWGGQLSVIRTDFWQLFLFSAGLLLALAFLISSQNSLTGFRHHVPQGHLSFPVSSGFGWYEVLVYYPLIVGLPYLVGPDIYSRVLCARNDHVARKSALLASLAVIPLSFLLAFFGILARAQFAEIPPETALPETLTSLVPTGIRGFITVGFLGAIMSSADTCLISASTILSLNVVRPLRRGSKELYLKVTRVGLVVVGGTAWLIAGIQQEIISSLLLGYTVFVGGVVLPTLATFCRNRFRVTPAGALSAVIVGGGTALLGRIHGGAVMKTLLTNEGAALLMRFLGSQYLSILPIVLSLAAMVVVSRLTRKPSQGTHA